MSDEKKKYLSEEEEEGRRGGTVGGKRLLRDAQFLHEDEEEGGSDTSGGRTGEIEFRYKDAMSSQPRDDQLPPEEIKRLLTIHKESHKDFVDKQRRERKDREAIKDGKPVYSADGRRKGIGGYGPGSGYSQFESHPTLSVKAQFSGVIDKKVTGIPNQAEADTNKDMQNNLELQNRLTAAPKPSSAPRLER